MERGVSGRVWGLLGMLCGDGEVEVLGGLGCFMMFWGCRRLSGVLKCVRGVQGCCGVSEGFWSVSGCLGVVGGVKAH